VGFCWGKRGGRRRLRSRHYSAIEHKKKRKMGKRLHGKYKRREREAQSATNHRAELGGNRGTKLDTEEDIENYFCQDRTSQRGRRLQLLNTAGPRRENKLLRKKKEEKEKKRPLNYLSRLPMESYPASGKREGDRFNINILICVALLIKCSGPTETEEDTTHGSFLSLRDCAKHSEGEGEKEVRGKAQKIPQVERAEAVKKKTQRSMSAERRKK